MSEMVERVAKAIAEQLGYGAHEHRVNDPNSSVRKDFMRAARAAIEAMREPTEAMIDAAHDLDEDLVVSPIHDRMALLKQDGPAAVWQAMISAALSPEEEGIGRG